MHVMRALIGVHRLQVHHVAHDLEIFLNAVAAMHVARPAGRIQRLAAVVALDDARSSRARHSPRPSAARRASDACRPSEISVIMLASFSWKSCVSASGLPNCLRSSPYCRAACMQNSAAPSTPQEMP